MQSNCFYQCCVFKRLRKLLKKWKTSFTDQIHAVILYVTKIYLLEFYLTISSNMTVVYVLIYIVIAQ